MTALIIAGEAIFLLPFIVMRVFKPIIRDVFRISDLEIGEAQALYGISALISYFFGGFIADKWEARKLLSISLIITSIGGVIMVSIPSIITFKILYGLWGISTIFLFWAALIKATRQWGDENNQGVSFGLLDGGRGLFAATIALFGASILSYFFPEEAAVVTYADKKITLQYILGAITGVVFLISLFVWFSLSNEEFKVSKENNFSFKQAFDLFKKRKIIFYSLLIMSAYSAYKITGVFGIYAKDVWGFSIENATYFAVFIQFTRPLTVVFVGWIGDKLSPSRLVLPCFIFIAIASILIGSGGFEKKYFILSFSFFVLIAIGTYSLRGLYFALIEEIKAPIQITGTLVGVISVIGFTPDIFMSLFTGYILGKDPAVEEYQYLFTMFSIFPIIGLIAAFLFRKRSIVWT
ncbi:MAG: nitrate/nitrite transporter NarK [Flavobacteriaceae bacterium]|jgi:nitrate/nitrite transporter NarK